MNVEKNLIEIKKEDLLANLKHAYNALKSSTYRNTLKTREALNAGMRRTASSYVGSGGQETSTSFSFEDTILGLDAENPLATDAQHHVLSVLQRAISVAAYVSDSYEKLTPLARLKEENRAGMLTGQDKTTYQELRKTQAYFAVFTLANFVQAKIGDVQDQQGAEFKGNMVIKDTMSLTTQFLYELHTIVEARNPDDESLQGIVKSYALSFIDEMRSFEGSLTNVDIIHGSQYRTDLWEFEISGFELSSEQRSANLTMTFKEPHEVIGNRIAKYQMKKLAKMMMCYDFKAQKNPFNELGGFIFTFMGDGNPGTGKTTLIQMLCGLLNDYCQNAGYTFYYENFSVDQIDSYQGKSGQNAKQFIRNVMNPKVIGFGTIDDIDQIAGKRGDSKSSGGQQEVTAVLMESFAGANTVVRGNCTFGMFSNYPENVDDALRQRAGARYLIDGPKTAEDFTDLLALLLQTRSEIDVGNAELFATQQIEGQIQKTYDQYNVPETPELKAVFDKVMEERGEIKTFEDFGYYLGKIQEAEPRFTGRAIKNIADAAKTRAMDVDLPDEWFEDTSIFLDKPYDEKLAMVKEFAQPVTPEMLLQETHRYADSEFRYSANSDEAAISQMVRDHELRLEANKRVQTA
tara:strand:- start:216 stop:2108 length:1893 start_codon:yes stop_codon:yes gene_type:complete